MIVIDVVLALEQNIPTDHTIRKLNLHTIYDDDERNKYFKSMMSMFDTSFS